MRTLLQKIEELKSNNEIYKLINTPNYILMINIILSVLFSISLFFAPFVYVIFGLCVISIILSNGLNKIYNICFWSIFANCFRVSAADNSMYAYILIIGCVLISVDFLIDVFYKKKKFNLVISILYATLAIFMALPIGGFSFTKTIVPILSLFIIFISTIKSNEIDFVLLAKIFIYGILISSIISVFRNIFKRVTDFNFNFQGPTENTVRFSALFTDPNFYSTCLMIALSLLVVLFIKDKINWHFYFILFAFSIFSYMTMSKMCYILYFVNIIALIVALSFKKQVLMKKLLSIGIALIVCVLSLFGVFKYSSKTLGRFGAEGSFMAKVAPKYDLTDVFEWMYKEEEIVIIQNNTNNTNSLTQPNQSLEVENQIYQEQIEQGAVEYLPAIKNFLNSKLGRWLNGLATFRLSLWLGYFSYLVQNPVALLFGVGENPEYLKIATNVGILQFEPHNSFIQFVYSYGLIGFGLVVAIVVMTILNNKNKFKNFNILSILPIFILFCCLMSLCWVGAYQVPFFILLASFCMTFVKREKVLTSEFKNDKIISNNSLKGEGDENV